MEEMVRRAAANLDLVPVEVLLRLLGDMLEKGPAAVPPPMCFLCPGFWYCHRAHIPPPDDSGPPPSFGHCAPAA